MFYFEKDDEFLIYVIGTDAVGKCETKRVFSFDDFSLSSKTGILSKIKPSTVKRRRVIIIFFE